MPSVKPVINHVMGLFGDAVQNVREKIAYNTIGRCGAAPFIPLVMIGMGGHIAMFVFGGLYKSECSEIQVLPVYMALLGCTGILKGLGFLIQLGIAVQLSGRANIEKRNIVAAEIMSETSIFDTGMNWLYTVIIFIGAGTVLPSYGIDGTLCNNVMFSVAFYPSLVLVSLTGILFLWIFVQFIAEACQACRNKSDEMDEDLEPIEI